MTTFTIRVPDMCCPVEFRALEKAAESVARAAAKEHAKLLPDYGERTVRIEITEATLSRDAFLAALRTSGLEFEVPDDAATTSDTTASVFLSVPEMDCPVEAGEIEKVFKDHALAGYVINIMNRTIAVPPDKAEEAIACVKIAGYEATVMSGSKKSAPAFEDNTPWKRYFLALAIALVSEAIELCHEYGTVDWGQTADIVSLVLAVVAIVLVGVGTFKKGIQSTLRGKLNMNALMAVAVTGGVLIGAWPEASMVMVLFEISEAIEQLSMTKARRSIRDLMNVAPETADCIQADGSVVPTPVDAVGPGALIRVAPGGRIPLDGKIGKGVTTLDQSMVTGESMPVEKGPGETVWAGTVNLTSTIDFTATAAASQSLTARIIEAVENAQAAKSNVQRFVDRFAEIYTPIVFALALLAAVLPPVFLGGEWHDWIYKALSLLVISCPCALVISTPVTIVSALATATRCGLLVKGGLFLEEARKIRFVGLDKTGTLTKGEPEVSDITLFGADRARALQLAGSLGAMSTHPLSQALKKAAQSEKLELLEVERFTALPGEGAEGVVGIAGTSIETEPKASTEAKNWLHGVLGEAQAGAAQLGSKLSLVNIAHLEKKGLATNAVKAAFEEAAGKGRSASALADAFGVLAVFSFSDDLKPDTAAGLKQLRAEGAEPWLLTGDNIRAASAIASKLDLKNVAADLLPEEKLERIKALQKEGLTAMVGDGINDAPALAQADIGIAMGVRGTDSAIEAADIAVMDDKISSIATLIRLSRMTHSVLVQNIVFALTIKVLFALMALGGMATMWMAVFADTGTCLIVVANGLRMLNAKPKLDHMAARIDAS